MRELIKKGLTAPNLRALHRLAETQFAKSPTFSSSLTAMLSSLVDEYDEFDAVPTERFQEVNRLMQPALLDVLDALDSGAAVRLLESLDRLHRDFHSLS
jgi:hypothetical protein